MRAVWLLPLSLLLSGCPNTANEASAPTPAVLQLDVDPGARKSRGPIVGETIQLRLSWGAGSAPKLLNTLVAKNGKTASWEVEPAGAVVVDPTSSRASLKASGDVTIRATYELEGRTIRSNPLRLRVREGSTTVNKTATETSAKTSR